MPSLPCTICNADMRWAGTSFVWRGDYEVTVQVWQCLTPNCNTTAQVEWRTFTPLPQADLEPPTEGTTSVE
jgi:hypothetical protein